MFAIQQPAEELPRSSVAGMAMSVQLSCLRRHMTARQARLLCCHILSDIPVAWRYSGSWPEGHVVPVPARDLWGSVHAVAHRVSLNYCRGLAGYRALEHQRLQVEAALRELSSLIDRRLCACALFALKRQAPNAARLALFAGMSLVKGTYVIAPTPRDCANWEALEGVAPLTLPEHTRRALSWLEGLTYDLIIPTGINPAWRARKKLPADLRGLILEGSTSYPILADLLEETGWLMTGPQDQAAAAIALAHLRRPQPHYEGCWVIERVLGRCPRRRKDKAE